MSCPSCFKIPFVNCCHVWLSLLLLIYQLAADCHRRWIMLQVDGMAGNPTTSLFLMRRLMGYQFSWETCISSGQYCRVVSRGANTRFGRIFEDYRGWWTRMDSGFFVLGFLLMYLYPFFCFQRCNGFRGSKVLIQEVEKSLQKKCSDEKFL